MSRRSREFLFRVCAVIAVGAAAFHAAAMVSPTIARIEYQPTYPMWRHAIFIVINGGSGWLFIRRPFWLMWAYAVLTLQILNGHGRGAWNLWIEHRRIEWISVGVSLLAPAILLLLFIDWRDRRESVHG